MTVILPIQLRTKKDKISSEQKAEQIPAVVYGAKFEAKAISVNKKEFDKTFKIAGESTIIELQGFEEPVEVLVKEVSFSPTKGSIVHVDFYVVEKGQEITTNIPLHFEGESPATKAGAVLNKVLHEVEVVCKPNKLPAHLDVDLTKLVQAEDRILISDIMCPAGVKISQDQSDVVALAETVADRTEDEATEEIDIADIEVEKKGKAEDEAEAEAK